MAFRTSRAGKFYLLQAAAAFQDAANYGGKYVRHSRIRSRSFEKTKASSFFALKVLGFVALTVWRFWFVGNYALRYVLHYSEAFYTDPLHGAANYWRERLWLISHLHRRRAGVPGWAVAIVCQKFWALRPSASARS